MLAFKIRTAGAPTVARRPAAAPRPQVVLRAALAEPAAPAAAAPLYLLHWHNDAQASCSPAAGPDAMLSSVDYVETLAEQVKVMEKVSKRAVWFSTATAGDGQHVLMVTDCAKLGAKYGLTALPDGAADFAVPLPGEQSVVVPVAAIRAAQAADKDGSDSDSDAEEGMEATAQAKALAKEAKKQQKALEKEAKKLAKDQKKAAKKEDEEKEKEKDKKKTMAAAAAGAMEDGESSESESESESESGSDEDDDCAVKPAKAGMAPAKA